MFFFCSWSNLKILFNNVFIAFFVSFLKDCILLFLCGKNKFKKVHILLSLFFVSDRQVPKHNNWFSFLIFSKSSDEMKKISRSFQQQWTYLLFKFIIAFIENFRVCNVNLLSFFVIFWIPFSTLLITFLPSWMIKYFNSSIGW